LGKTRKNTMSDYNLQISWSGKDALADSDPDKVVSGGDFNTEFLAVKTAVNSKADLANTSQVVTAATASAGTNTNQVATTAFVTAAMTAATINNLVYPVGSVYVNATVSTNPATLLGVGTWVAYGEGRVPVGKAGSGTFDTLGATGGAETDSHTLTEAEMPTHYHDSIHGFANGTSRPDSFIGIDGNLGGGNFGGGTDDDAWGSSQTKTKGGGGAHTHDILQPYIVVYMWKRTA
jgi:microcystin-dependent protein